MGETFGIADAGAARGRGDSRTIAAIQALKANPQKRWTSRELAREAGVSVSLLYQLFFVTFGVPPMSYLRTIRIASARRLLSETDQSIGSVGEQVGFASESHFCRAFRELVGVSPLQFRRKVRSSVISGNI